MAASVAASLLPPLLLARCIDSLTAGLPLTIWAVLAYFASLALEGVLSSAQESLLVVFGQKMTHALRLEMSLQADPAARRHAGGSEPRRGGCAVLRRCGHGGGTVHVGHHQHGGGRLPHHFYHDGYFCKNPGLALILLLVLPLFAVFTRHVQKRMLAAQLDNRRAVAAVSGQVPETLHNIRTIRALGMEAYMERRYDQRIADSYSAMERTNFYDAIYSPPC